jgi:hypothetical protein
VAVLLNSTGQPEPPTHVVKRLQALHAGLHLRFLGLTGEHWAVCMTWSPEDRRWERVQQGKTDPASTYDIIGYLPLDCGVDQAASHLERVFRQYPKDEVRNMADHVQAYNESAPVGAAIEEALAEALDSPLEAPKKRGRPRKGA